MPDISCTSSAVDTTCKSIVAEGAPEGMTDPRGLLRNAVVVGGTTVLSRLLALFRDIALACFLGSGPLAEAFLVAFRLPDLFRRLFGDGTLAMAFVGVFSRVRMAYGHARLFSLARCLFFWGAIVGGSLCCVGMLAAPVLTGILAPGFLRDTALFESTVSMVRICLPYIFFICITALCVGLLNAMGRFAAPAFAPCLFNLVLIGALTWGYVGAENPAMVLAWAVPLAGVVQLLFLVPWLWSNGFRLHGPWSMADGFAPRAGKVAGAAAAGAAMYQMTIILGALFASFLPPGSIAGLYYADRLVQLPVGVVGVALGTVALPGLSALFARGAHESYAHTLGIALRLSLFVSLPATAGLLALANPLVELLFGRGAFDQGAVAAAALALKGYAPGLPAVVLARPLVAALLARGAGRTLVFCTVVSLAVYLGTAVCLVFFGGLAGLAFAGACGAWMHVLCMSYALSREGVRVKGIMSGACLYAGLSGILWMAVTQFAAGMDSALLTVGLLVPGAMVAYTGVAMLLRIPEICLLAEALGVNYKR